MKFLGLFSSSDDRARNESRVGVDLSDIVSVDVQNRVLQPTVLVGSAVSESCALWVRSAQIATVVVAEYITESLVGDVKALKSGKVMF